MKKLLLLAFPVLLCFTACKKENISESSNNALFLTADEKSNIRYEFSATVAGTYGFDTETNELASSERVKTDIYSKTVTVSGSPVNASFTVYPPTEWENTGITATIRMRIYLNDKEIASKEAEIYYTDRHPGIKLTAFIK